MTKVIFCTVFCDFARPINTEISRKKWWVSTGESSIYHHLYYWYCSRSFRPAQYSFEMLTNFFSHITVANRKTGSNWRTGQRGQERKPSGHHRRRRTQTHYGHGKSDQQETNSKNYNRKSLLMNKRCNSVLKPRHAASQWFHFRNSDLNKYFYEFELKNQTNASNIRQRGRRHDHVGGFERSWDPSQSSYSIQTRWHLHLHRIYPSRRQSVQGHSGSLRAAANWNVFKQADCIGCQMQINDVAHCSSSLMLH